MAVHRPEVRQLARYALFLAGTTVFIASVLPGIGPSAAYGADKLAHAAAFGVVSALVAVGYVRPSARVMALAGVALLGSAIEVAQSFVPGRLGSVWDWLADIAGLPIGMVAGLALDHLFRAQRWL